MDAKPTSGLDWSDRFHMWRTNWFPFRTYEYLGADERGLNFGPAQWESPSRGPIRWVWDVFA